MHLRMLAFVTRSLYDALAFTALHALLFFSGSLRLVLAEATICTLSKGPKLRSRKILGCLEEASSALGRKYKKAEDAWEGRPVELG